MNGYFDQSFDCLSFTPLHMTCVMGDPTGCSTFQTVNNIFWHISDGRGGYSHDNYISASPTGCSTFQAVNNIFLEYIGGGYSHNTLSGSPTGCLHSKL